MKRSFRKALGVAVIAASLVSVLTACETDTQRLERLTSAKHTAVLRVIMWEQRLEEKVPGAADSLAAAKTRLQLANRELNLFMLGR